MICSKRYHVFYVYSYRSLRTFVSAVFTNLCHANLWFSLHIFRPFIDSIKSMSSTLWCGVLSLTTTNTSSLPWKSPISVLLDPSPSSVFCTIRSIIFSALVFLFLLLSVWDIYSTQSCTYVPFLPTFIPVLSTPTIAYWILASSNEVISFPFW